MIEMLGVLAIIGVLSAGGIMGYSAAMENYKVNQTIDMIVKANSTVAQYFIKRAGGNAYNTTGVEIPVLCRLGVLPSEICNATATEGIRYRKGYFGEAIQVYVQQSGSSLTGWQTYDIIKSDNSGSYKMYGPTTRLAFGWYDTPPKLGKSACVKLLTSPAWQGLGKTTFVEALNNETRGCYELPLSVAIAETKCVNGITYNTRIYTYSEGRRVNN